MAKTGKTKSKTNLKNDKNKEKAIHPYSRKAKQIAKRIHHHNKVETSKNSRVAKLELVAEKLRWFQNHLDDRKSYTKEDLTNLVLEYRNRFEDELEQINIVQSIGKRHKQNRQHAGREAAIKITKEDEKNHFEGCGMEVPDIVTAKNLDSLKNWQGELNFIQNIKLVKVSSHGVVGLQSLKQTSDKETVDTSSSKMSDDGGGSDDDEEDIDDDESIN